MSLGSIVKLTRPFGRTKETRKCGSSTGKRAILCTRDAFRPKDPPLALKKELSQRTLTPRWRGENSTSSSFTQTALLGALLLSLGSIIKLTRPFGRAEKTRKCSYFSRRRAKVWIRDAFGPKDQEGLCGNRYFPSESPI